MKEAPLPDAVYHQLADETQGHYLVGMDPTEFLETFLPWNENTPTSYQQQVPHVTRANSLESVPLRIGKGKLELSMYKKYVKALDGWVTGMDNGQQLRFAHFTKPDIECASPNVDVATYWQSDFPSDPSHASCKFSLQQTHEKLMVDYTYDPFVHDSDEGPETQNPSENAANESDFPNSTQTAVTIREDSQDAGMPAIPVGVVTDGDAGSVGLDKDSDKTLDESYETATVKDSQHNLEENVERPPLEDTTNDSEQITNPNDVVFEVETDTQNAIRTRGQIAAYAGVAMSMAFRTHFFSLLILGEYARLIRWDRRGAIVSTRFNYTRRPTLIFGFYLRFGQLSLRQRGFDTNTVRVPSQTLPDDVASAFDKYCAQSWYEGAKFSHYRNKEDGPQMPAKESNFYRVTVNDSISNQTEAFFVPAPAYRLNMLKPFTRGSRRSLAFLDHPNRADRKMCFMKDSWQEVSVRSEPEADIYRKLHENGVPNIASMRLGDDIADMETETQKWWGRLEDNGRYRRFGRMVCHRLVWNTVARDLSTFTWCKVLLSCLADVVDAAQAAFKAGVLHRDISAGNIMIVKDETTKEWRGILIDWDMCLILDERHKSYKTRTAQTGTWGFISARILGAPPSNPVMHSLGDDMESIFWVFVYQVLLYTRHEDGPCVLYRKTEWLFYDYNANMVEKTKVGTIASCALGCVNWGLGRFKMTALSSVFHTLGTYFLTRYPPDQDCDQISELLELPSRIRSVGPAVDWDSPDEKWFSNFLRQAAHTMDPLGITPTALESPNNDSQPPLAPTVSKRAKISRCPPDYFEMKCSKDDKDSKNAEDNAYSRVLTSSQMNKIDGHSASSTKRRLEVDDEAGHGMEGGEKFKLKRQWPL